MVRSSSSSTSIEAGDLAEQRADYLEAVAAYQTALRDPDPVVVGDAQHRLGRVAWRQGNYPGALASFELARMVAMRHGDTELRARAEFGVGMVHYARGDYTAARASYALALKLTAEEARRGMVQLNLGIIANIEGHLDEARAAYMASRESFRSAGDINGEAQALHNLGMFHADRVEWDAANACYEESLSLSRQTGNREMIGLTLMNRSELNCAMGRYRDAIDLCDAALVIFSQIGAEVLRGTALRWKGRALRELHDYTGAERALYEAVRIAHRSHSQLLEAESMQELAGTMVLGGDSTEARRLFVRALVIFESLGAQREAEEVRADLSALD